MSQMELMQYNNQKFQILAHYATPNTHCNIPDHYAYAWYRGIYPNLDNDKCWHQTYNEYFSVSKEAMECLLDTLSDEYDKHDGFSFYKLERHYGLDGFNDNIWGWDRTDLMAACKYFRLEGAFDDEFWATFSGTSDSPSEAHSIRRDFSPSDMYF